MNYLLSLFRRTTAAVLRQQSLEAAEVSLVQAQIGLEYYRSQVEYHSRVIAKLNDRRP